MNKYQRVMEHVKVDDEMKKRILQNLEKKLESGADQARSVESLKVVPFKKRLGDGIKRYGGMVAMVAILLVGTAAVIRFTGGVSNTSAPSMSDSAMEAPAAAPAEEAAEAPAATESAYEEAAEAPAQEAEMAAGPASNEGLMEAESPVYDSETTAEQAEEETVEPADSTQSTGSAQSQDSSETSKPSEPAQPVGSAKTEGAEQEIIGSTQPSVVHYIGPVVLLIIVLAVIALIIWLIIYLIRKYRSRK
ncbi:MAG: hypothetical protein ILA12_03230 [Butyrivibrio sp.]|nr:hypothetical protein [Butyrivibrio sp.]MBP3813644.1 hypothetical protein [Butyrivibrio sp.]